MANDEVFKISLDDKEFLEKLLKAKGVLGSLGDTKGLEGVGKTMIQIGKFSAVLAASFLALKGTMDAVFKGDEIKKSNEQFEILTRTAGVSSESIRQGFLDATNGMISTHEAIQVANEAVVKLGSSAKRLPEIMQLARKAAEITGQGTAETFERMSQALASGSSRALKQFGIIVDSEKVYRDYAKSIGVAVDELTEQAKIQAITNAAIDSGKKNLAGISTGADDAKDSFTRMAAQIREVGEALTLIINKIGPALKLVFDGIAERAKYVSTTLKASFGEGADAAAAKAEMLEIKIQSLRGEMIDLEQKKLHKGFLFDAFDEAKLTKLPEKIKALQTELATLKAETPAGKEGPEVQQDLIDYEKRKQNLMKFQSEILKIKEQNLQNSINQATQLEQVDALSAQRKVVIEQQFQLQLQQIRESASLSGDQKVQMEIELATQKNLKLIEMEQNLQAEREKSLDNYLKAAQSTSEGVARAFQIGAQKASMENQKFGDHGKRVFKSFETHSVDALHAFGAGTKSAADAAKGFVLNMLADEADARGKVMMLASIFPPNPAGIAAGAGLIALAGFLRSQAGGAGGGGAGVPGAGSIGGPTREGETSMVDLKEKDKKMISIQVQGNYFETEQTRTRLVDIIRESSDFTDFQFKQIGQ